MFIGELSRFHPHAEIQASKGMSSGRGAKGYNLGMIHVSEKSHEENYKRVQSKKR